MWVWNEEKASLIGQGGVLLTFINQDHRIIEEFGLEGIFKGHLVQHPGSKQGHVQLDQSAQSPVQPDFECLQGWGIDHLSGQPVPVLHHPHCKKFLPYVQSKSTLFEFKTATPCPIATGPGDCSSQIFG